jgi:bacteriorhodopsin
MNELLPLTADQYLLLKNLFNLSMALLGAASLLFILTRRMVAPTYSLAVSMMAAVTAMACFHYFRIYENWLAAFTQQGALYVPSGVPFSYAYRYADWLGTVPLLVTAVMLVLDLGRRKTASLISRTAVSAALMIALGYVGEIQHSDMTLRAAWGLASCVPFGYMLYVLWSELTRVLKFESERVRELFAKLRWGLLVSWCFYPVVYALPILGLGGADHLLLIQVGNSAADLLAKVGTGLFILTIAREKTEEELIATRDSVSLPSAAD